MSHDSNSVLFAPIFSSGNFSGDRHSSPLAVKLSKIWTEVSETLGFRFLCNALVCKTLRAFEAELHL
jgi:hypothetical protein